MSIGTWLGAARRHRNYVLAMLTAVYVVNYLDRQILGILLPLIRKDFHLSDSALGLLAGPAFAVVYATLGVPLSLLADRMNRRNIILGSLALFSVMTVFCSYAANFTQLLFARFGTGIGEAGTAPSISSIISDLFPPHRRATAFSIYISGLNIGLVIAFFGGGYVAQHFGWRAAFLAAGMPGLVLVFLLLFTVEEPRRGHVDALDDSGPVPGLIETIRYLWSQRSFRFIALGTSMSAFGGYAGLAWTPSFFSRTHHMTPFAIGLLLSLTTGTIGFMGTALSGLIVDRFGRADARWSMYVPIIAIFIGIPFQPVLYLSSNLDVAMAALVVPAFVGAAYLGPAYALSQSLAPLRMRAKSSAILLFILNIIGLGLGPQTVGIVSDLLRPRFGADSLRYALLTSIVTGLLAALCYWRASLTVRSDMARVRNA